MPVKVEGNARAKFAATAAALPGVSRKAVSASARVVKREIERGAPARLRGVGRKGARLGVSYTVRGEGSQTTALVRATGPWQFIENDTKAHEIGPKRARTRGGRRVAVMTPQGPRSSVRHPGTRGKHPWARGVERAAPLATRAFEAEVIGELRKKFS